MFSADLQVIKETSGLELPQPMSDKQLKDYCFELDAYITALPNITYELARFSIVRDYVGLKKKLYDLSLLLKRIHAIKATNEAFKLIDLLEGQSKAEINQAMEKFTALLMTLSIDIQLAQHKSTMQNDQKNTEQSLEKRSILVVDDEAVILKAVKQIIDSTDYKFVGTASGKAALKYLETHEKPAMFILDIEMPEMNGYELAEKIAERSIHVPIIFFTNSATRENVQKAMSVGACDFLVKPANKNLILKKIEMYLE